MHSNVDSTITNNGQGQFYSGIQKMTLNSDDFVNTASVVSMEELESVDPTDPNTNSTLLSDDTKIFWATPPGLFHMFVESFPKLLGELERYENPIIIINDKPAGDDADKFSFKFLLDYLDDKGYRWEIYHHGNDLIAKNFVLFAHNFMLIENIRLAKTEYAKYANNNNVLPFRKVYLSRKHISPRDYYWIKDGLSTKVDERIIDDEILEAFLENKGFEIVAPEQRFDNLVDQIKYFNEAKIVLSATSSGIGNSMFMQDNTSIIELVTSFPNAMSNADGAEPGTIEGEEVLHHFYHMLSYVTKTAYVGIPNQTRKAQDIIDYIESHELLNKIICE